MVFIPVTFKKWPKSKLIEIYKFHFVKCLDGYTDLGFHPKT